MLKESGEPSRVNSETSGTPSLIPPAPDASALVPGIALPYGELQHAVTYLALTRLLRITGIVNIIQGLALLSGPILVIWIIFTELHMGIYFRHILPLPYSLLIFVFGLLSFTDFILGFVFLITRSTTSLLLLAVSGKWHLYRRYRQLGPCLEHAPRPATLREASELLHRISSSKIKTTPDLIHFISAGNWRGLLGDDMAILVRYSSLGIRFSIDDIRFISPDEFSLTPMKRTISTLFSNWLSVSCRIDDLNMKGIISPACFERYQAWKTNNPIHIDSVPVGRQN